MHGEPLGHTVLIEFCENLKFSKNSVVDITKVLFMWDANNEKETVDRIIFRLWKSTIYLVTLNCASLSYITPKHHKRA